MTPQTLTKTIHDVLQWILEDADIAGVFLHSTGLEASDIADRLEDPEFLAAVLDFVMMDDEWVIAAARQAGLNPVDLQTLRAQLPGGDTPSWT